jgi:signal transduction histidine kinase
VPRRFLTDAALAVALFLLTIGPGLVMGLMAGAKPGDVKTGIPADGAWWLLAGLIGAGLLIRQQWPVAALVLTGLGTLGHLVLATKFQLLDLALPLAMYTVAAVARRRRTALAVLGMVMILVYAGTLAGRLREDQQELRVEKVVTGNLADKPAKLWAGSLLDTSQAVLEMWLLLLAAYAVGDAMRSRRAHLAAVEQQTADRAREERQRGALAVAAERARITRELHDVVAHGMSVMVVQAHGAAAALNRHPERTARALQHVIETGRASLAEMRGLLAIGRTDPAEDPQLGPQPGITAVPSLVEQVRATGVPVTLHIGGTPVPAPPSVDLSAYRIVQEALTNVLKHAKPGAAAVVRLQFEAERLRVEVTDDGTGPVDTGNRSGIGLRGIADRVAMLGGDLVTGRVDGTGFRVCATLPLPNHRDGTSAVRPA